MGSPPVLTREQVNSLAGHNGGTPFMIARVEVKASAPFVHDLPLRENDVYLLTLAPANSPTVIRSKTR
jgi:hypothetical protein